MVIVKRKFEKLKSHLLPTEPAADQSQLSSSLEIKYDAVVDPRAHERVLRIIGKLAASVSGLNRSPQ